MLPEPAADRTWQFRGVMLDRCGLAVLNRPPWSGLGVFISRQIIEAHGGRIQFEDYDGEAASFVVELPLR
jgi:signal transduction histidine kinase